MYQMLRVQCEEACMTFSSLTFLGVVHLLISVASGEASRSLWWRSPAQGERVFCFSATSWSQLCQLSHIAVSAQRRTASHCLEKVLACGISFRQCTIHMYSGSSKFSLCLVPTCSNTTSDSPSFAPISTFGSTVQDSLRPPYLRSCRETVKLETFFWVNLRPRVMMGRM